MPTESRDWWAGHSFRVHPRISNTRRVADLPGIDRATTDSFDGASAGTSETVTGKRSGWHAGQVRIGFTAQVADGVSLLGSDDF